MNKATPHQHGHEAQHRLLTGGRRHSEQPRLKPRYASESPTTLTRRTQIGTLILWRRPRRSCSTNSRRSRIGIGQSLGAELARRVALAPHDLPQDDLVAAADRLFTELDRRERPEWHRRAGARSGWWTSAWQWACSTRRISSPFRTPSWAARWETRRCSMCARW